MCMHSSIPYDPTNHNHVIVRDADGKHNENVVHSPSRKKDTHKNPQKSEKRKKKTSRWRRTWRMLKIVVEESLSFGVVPFALCYAHVYLHRKQLDHPWYAFLAPWLYSSSSSPPWWVTSLYSSSYDLSPLEFLARASRYGWHCDGGLSKETLKATFFAHGDAPEESTTPYPMEDLLSIDTHNGNPPPPPPPHSSRRRRLDHRGDLGGLGWLWPGDGERPDRARETPTRWERLTEWWTNVVVLGSRSGMCHRTEGRWKKWSPLFSALFFHANRFHLFMNVLTWACVHWESRLSRFGSPFLCARGEGWRRRWEGSEEERPASPFHHDASTAEEGENEAEEAEASEAKDEAEDAGAVSGEREKWEAREHFPRDVSTSFSTMPTSTTFPLLLPTTTTTTTTFSSSPVWDANRESFGEAMGIQVVTFVVGGILGGHGGAWLWRRLVFSRHWRLLCHAAASADSSSSSPSLSPSCGELSLPQEKTKWWNTAWWASGVFGRKGENQDGVHRVANDTVPAPLLCTHAWCGSEKRGACGSGGSRNRDIPPGGERMWRRIGQQISSGAFSFLFAWLYPPYVRWEREGVWDGLRASWSTRKGGEERGHGRVGSSGGVPPSLLLPSVRCPCRASPNANRCFSYLFAEQRTFQKFAESWVLGASGSVMAYNGWYVGRWCRQWIAARHLGRDVQDGLEREWPNTSRTLDMPSCAASTVSLSHRSRTTTRETSPSSGPPPSSRCACGHTSTTKREEQDGGVGRGGGGGALQTPQAIGVTQRWRRQNIPVPFFSLSLATREVLLFTLYLVYLLFCTSIPTDVEPCIFPLPKTLFERFAERLYGCSFFPPSPVCLIRSFQWMAGLWWRQEVEVGVWALKKDQYVGAGAVSCACHTGGLVVGFLLGFWHG